MNNERRIFQGKIQVRQLPGEPRTVNGLAARYDSLSNDLGGFKERIAPGAFRSVLNNCDCRCLVNHDPNKVLGRTKSGTLTLLDAPDGLAFRCELPNASFADDLYESVKRGDMDQCSFGFRVGDDDWDDDGVDENGQRCIIRTIRSFATLEDVSVVTYPAYEDTVAMARNLPESVLAEVRKRTGRATQPGESWHAAAKRRLQDSFKRVSAQDKEVAKLPSTLADQRDRETTREFIQLMKEGKL